MSKFTLGAATKTVVVLGGSYGGSGAARVLAQSLPKDWRVILVDRNSHINHVYALPRFGILPGHEYKGFIPYTKILERNLTSVAPVAEHEYIHGHIVSLSPSSITVNELTQSTTSKAASPPRRIPFDYAIYALGSHLPAPINLWGPVPSQSIGSSTVEQPVSSINGYSGFKPEGIEWLQKHQAVVKKSESILVVGGGALGIQYATDIAAVYPGKQITLLHSRNRLLPRFDEAMHDEAIKRITEADISLILGKRLDLSSVNEVPAKRNGAGQRIVRSEAGDEIAADLIFLCTGQKPNTELLAAMDPKTIVPGTGQARVLRSMQLAPIPQIHIDTAASYIQPSTSETQSPYPHIFVIGDAADAFGAIPAGHNAYSQAELAARNILRLIEHKSNINSSKLWSTDNSPELEQYIPGPPGIKVSLGLRRSVIQRDGKVTTKDDGLDDLETPYMWRAYGHDNPTDEYMRL